MNRPSQYPPGDREPAAATTNKNVPEVFGEWQEKIAQAMGKDRFRLRRQLQKIREHHNKQQAVDTLQDKFLQQLDRSIEQLQQRQAIAPRLDFPLELPVSERWQEIAETVKQHQVVVLAGATGSGKTTQIPKICLALGRGREGMIGHTQPRRLAARTVAHRIADEMGVKLGEAVGYQVRFTDYSQDTTLVKLMTDGVLLAEVQRDRFLSRYDTIIIDEAHERSLNIDFLLGYLKQLLPKRPDLKLIITSATIDVERFSRHFSSAPIIEVSGRTYPVDILYRPLAEGEEVLEQADAIIRAIEELQQIEKADPELDQLGDVLVFLSGEREIRDTALALRRAQLPHCEVLPLYARLSDAEQNRVFDLSLKRGRRIVLATNVAETSLTVPGIRYVVDPGYARISRYSYRTKVQRLPIEPVSQASANQRAGRCGRVGKGVCVRLYDEADYQSRSEFTDAEIQRTNLASVILQMLIMGLGKISAFPFVDPPDQRMVNDGFKLLEELSAVDNKRQLTELGRQLARLPLDPRLARMLLCAGQEACVSEVMIIVSALSIQDPRERPADKQQAADEKHRRFADEKSDFVSLLKLWHYFEQQRQSLSKSQLRKLCQREFLSYMRMREWRDIHHQLRLSCKEMGLKENTLAVDAENQLRIDNYQGVHRALLSGLLSHIGFKYENRDYLGARNRKFKIFPGSFLHKKQPKWLVAAELVETTQLYARINAAIESDWVFGLSDHLLKRTISEPHFSAKRGDVIALEKVSLYGLVVRDKVRVSLSNIDPVLARQVFIREALVAQQWRGDAQFYQHNSQVLRDLEELEAKARRRDIVADEEVLYEFYAQHLPAHICNARSLAKWLKKDTAARQRLLSIPREQLMLRQAHDLGEAQFPKSFHFRDLQFGLEYHFEPGHPRDGVSALIPIGLLNRVPKHAFEWLVPGMLLDKCVALVKTLPKHTRKHFVPVPEYALKALANIDREACIDADQALLEVLGEQLRLLTGLRIPAEEWDVAKVDSFHQMNFRLLNEQGGLIEQSRDIAYLAAKYRDKVQQSLNIQSEVQSEQQLHTRWDFPELAAVERFQQAGVEVEAYPALVDQGDGVSTVLCDYAFEANIQHRQGLLRLYLLAAKETVKYLRKELLRDNRVVLQTTNLGGREKLVDDIIRAVFLKVFVDSDGSAAGEMVRNEQAFQQRLRDKRGDVVREAQLFECVFIEILERYHSIQKHLKGKIPPAWLTAVQDIQTQLDALIYVGFAENTPFEWFQRIPVYLQAIEERLAKLAGQVQKDKNATLELNKAYHRMQEKIGRDAQALEKDPQLVRYRWMLEEFRVSLFAQTLGTTMPVSAKRLEKQWQRVQQ